MRSTVKPLVLLSTLALLAGVMAPALAGPVSREAALAAGGPVAIDGNTLVSGADVFARTGTTWTKQATLPITDPPEFFAISDVAIDEDTVVMGVVSTLSSDSPQPGLALVYERSGTIWTERARLTSTNPAVGDAFGESVDVSGSTIVVGATGDSTAAMWAGAAYVFTRDGAAWTRQAKLFPAGAQAFDFFGRVAVDGDTLVAGATGTGAAYVYTRSGSTWTQQASLAPASGSSLFGSAVDVDGDVVAVAALRDSAVVPSGGAVFVYTRSGATWSETAKLTPGDLAADLRFGTAVAVDGNHVVATRSGFTGEAGPDTGVAYVFEKGASGWAETNGLTSATPTAADNFGFSVALDAGTIAAPAQGTATSGPATYVFHLGLPRIGDGIGLVDPATGLWYLLDDDGLADPFYYGNPGDVPFMGDWNCDGIDTPGLYRQSDGFVYLRNSNTQGIAGIRYFFGDPGDVPLAGDFDGDGCDTVSLYRPGDSRVFVINVLGSADEGLGAADLDYLFGSPGDKPLTGEFNGDRIDTIALHRESTGLVYFRNSHTQGVADFEFIFGDPGDRVLAGDWNLNGIDTPAAYRPGDMTFYFRLTNTQGAADEQVSWGDADWLPVSGKFGLFSNAPAEAGRPSIQDAAAFAQAFLDARIAGSGAEASLGPLAAGRYADPTTGLMLYSGFTAAAVVNIWQTDTSSFEVWTQLFGTGGVIGPGVKREVMAVGSGEDLGGVPRDLIVRSAAAIP